MKISFGQRSDKGMLRSHNEDAFGHVGSAEADVFIVADGLGGLAFGEVASAEAVEGIKRAFFAARDTGDGGWLEQAFREVNASIFSANSRRSTAEHMATTLTVSQFSGNELTLAHVGDCRVYQARSGRLQCLTRDHSVAANILTRTIGSEAEADPDFVRVPLRTGDRYLQCSDGLYHMMSDDEILNTLHESGGEESICSMLVGSANRKGGLDNITVQVIRVHAP